MTFSFLLRENIGKLCLAPIACTLLLLLAPAFSQAQMDHISTTYSYDSEISEGMLGIYADSTLGPLDSLYLEFNTAGTEWLNPDFEVLHFDSWFISDGLYQATTTLDTVEDILTLILVRTSGSNSGQGLIAHLRCRGVITAIEIDIFRRRGAALSPELPTVKVYPNPTQGAVWIEAEGREVTHYWLQDATGRQLRAGAYPGDKVSLSGLPSGTYVLQVLVAGKRSVHRLSLQ
ncbi:MAG: T9SS type A sorting domain-containing protein [Bacteroidota bacterium]